MSLTIELLDSMLSPDAGRRRSAESAYGAIGRPDRLRGLTSILLHLLSSPPPSLSPSSSSDDGRGAMAAVLLRREIGAPDDGAAATAESMVGISAPLLALFRRAGGGGGGRSPHSAENNNARRQLGHCIAELCRALGGDGAIPAPPPRDNGDGGRGWMRAVLTDLVPGVSVFSPRFRGAPVG